MTTTSTRTPRTHVARVLFCCVSNRFLQFLFCLAYIKASTYVVIVSHVISAVIQHGLLFEHAVLNGSFPSFKKTSQQRQKMKGTVKRQEKY
jgi:hypothetical protein